MAQQVNITELTLPQLEVLKNQLDQEVEFLSSSIAQLKVVQTKYVEAKDCLNVLNKSNEDVRPREALRRWPRVGRRGDRLLRRKDSRQCPRFLQEEDRLSDQTDGENSAGTAGKTCHETSCDGNDEPEDPAANGHGGFTGCSNQGIAFGIGSPGPARCTLTVAFCSLTSRVLKPPTKQLGPKSSWRHREASALCAGGCYVRAVS
ncbi:prefoldin subunit 5 isoform X1 [Chelonia mydas]|uniref:prefoldin subunit 5 isoform X1 n=1 Tax=Chelonia mydas TaxID=8469 RepID=UPI001CA96260|nr:prefoldin subunit 5 isoform X1 [Chelonia mydas]